MGTCSVVLTLNFFLYNQVPTFVNFLYDVESPDEVREYVTSYLGENGGAKEFSKIFLEMRSKSCSLSKESSIIQVCLYIYI